MNTREELQLALRDLQNDTFVWRDDPEWAQQAAHVVARHLGALSRAGRPAAGAAGPRQPGASTLTNGRAAQRHGGSPQYGHSAPVATLPSA